jgi:DNA mismatch repair protein MutS
VSNSALDSDAQVPPSARKTGPDGTQKKAATGTSKGSATSESGAAVTPMMVQYLAIKEAHPDCLLFYRMGDFYELFFEDAIKASRALDITLTHRGKHQGADIPMCGVPVHSHDSYLARLIRQGFKVAVCEQTENPAEAKKRGAKSVVAREVVRLITPGTLTEEKLLDHTRNNFLAALADAQGALALAWLDISTGEFVIGSVSVSALGAEIARLAPGEILLSERLAAREDIARLVAGLRHDDVTAVTIQPTSLFDSTNGEQRLKHLFSVAALDAFGAFDRAGLAAAGALVDYVELTQKGTLPRISPPVAQRPGTVMEIDAQTRRNLELTSSLSGAKHGTLLDVIDRSSTGAGARLVAGLLAAPLTDTGEINRRLDAVAWLVDDEAAAEIIKTHLDGAPDVERALARVTVGRGGPRDLAAIRDGLERAAALGVGLNAGADKGLAGKGLVTLPSLVRDWLGMLGDHAELVTLLGRALGDSLPLLARDGGFVAKGYDAALDETRALRDESRRLIAALEQGYREASKIPNLRIRHNNVLGYFIEVRPGQADLLRDAPGPQGQEKFFHHRQTIASAVRFNTEELVDLETRIARAADKALAQELEIFQHLTEVTITSADGIALAARALAWFDVSAGFARLAHEADYVRPRVDDSLAFRIEAGRHPVVESVLRRDQAQAFVPNDCDLSTDKERDDDRPDAGAHLWLITGPNMAGKSTFLRQNAVIAILAQIGCFVPACAAHIGVVDKLFSRVGAADDLARGRSTFMVEMVETAAILNQAGERALVILDEIGRGTATFDGLSIAWATIEHLHGVNRCRGLFATHYHELTALTARLGGLANHAMQVKEWQGDVVFLHEVGPGTADRSYGIHVARLAGLPEAALVRAEEVLTTLEQGDKADQLSRLADDLPLFAARPAAKSIAPVQKDSALEAALGDIHPDGLTPKDALDLIYRLKALANPEPD